MNPYDPPQSNEPAERPWYRRRKPWWGYPAAVVLGALAFLMVLGPPLAVIDDSGGTQLMIGAFLGLVIYAVLF